MMAVRVVAQYLRENALFVRGELFSMISRTGRSEGDSGQRSSAN
jgi:hypothetical protein